MIRSWVYLCPATRKGRAETQEGGKSSRQDSDATGKPKATDDCVESKVVATIEGRPVGGFDNRRMRTSNDMRWARNYSAKATTSIGEHARS